MSSLLLWWWWLDAAVAMVVVVADDDNENDDGCIRGGLFLGDHVYRRGGSMVGGTKLLPVIKPQDGRLVVDDGTRMNSSSDATRC